MWRMIFEDLFNLLIIVGSIPVAKPEWSRLHINAPMPSLYLPRFQGSVQFAGQSLLHSVQLAIHKTIQQYMYWLQEETWNESNKKNEGSVQLVTRFNYNDCNAINLVAFKSDKITHTHLFKCDWLPHKEFTSKVCSSGFCGKKRWLRSFIRESFWFVWCFFRCYRKGQNTASKVTSCVRELVYGSLIC